MVQEGIGQPDRRRKAGSRTAHDGGLGLRGPLRHGADEGHGCRAAEGPGACGSGRWPRAAATRVDRDRGRFEHDADAAVAVGPEDARSPGLDPRQRRRGGMAVRIAGPGRRHGHGRIDGVEEGIRGRGLAAVVGDLQQVHVSEACQQLGVDLLLDVAREQEPMAGHRAEQDDRHVVDPGAGVRWLAGHRTRHRPQDLERDVVDGEPISGGEEGARNRTSGQFCCPRRVSGTGPDHPRLECATHPIPLEQHREPGNVVLMRVRQDDSVEPAIPWRDQPIELDEQPVGIRSAVDQQAPAARALDEDRVALPDVEDRHGRVARRPLDDDGRRQDDRRRQGNEREAGRARPTSWSGVFRGLPAGHRCRPG
jgi:hypothetical protein